MEKQKQAIEAVIFDLGRVLVHLKLDSGIFNYLRGSSKDDSEQTFLEILKNPAFSAYNAGKMTPQQFYRLICDQVGLDLTFEHFIHKWCDIFETMPGMESLVGDLKSKFKIGLLSDTDPLHWNYISSHWPFISRIEYPTLSFEIGCCKPAAQAFLKAAANVACPPEKCLYIDDLAMNVKAAQSVGFNAIQFQNPRQIRKDIIALGLLV